MAKGVSAHRRSSRGDRAGKMRAVVNADTPASPSPTDDRTRSLTSEPVDDWPARASATVVEYVAKVRDKTTGPALAASRNVVYFAAVALIAFVAVILLLLLLVRVLVAVTAYLPFVEQGESWLAYLVLGAVFLLAGLFMWRKKEPR